MKTGYMLSCAVAALVCGSMGAAAQQADQSNGIEAVVVTAERRSESVQNVPTTVQAFSDQQLQDLHVTDFSDLLKYTPNVNFGNNGPGQGEITMRGLSNGFRGNQSSGTIANFPNVALYVDDQSMQFPGRNLDVYVADMQRIEILEGPQGTLFGGGAEAGAVRYITNKPKLDTLEASAQADYGFVAHGDANTALSAVLNVPIIDGKLAVRAVIYDDRQGGYIDNVPSTFTRSNNDLGNAYFNIKPTAGRCPNGLGAGSSGFCALPNAPVGNNASTAANNFNPVERSGGRLSALYKIAEDWDFLVSESLQDLNAQGLSVEYPTGSDFQPLQPYQVTAFAPSYNKDNAENTAWTLNGKLPYDLSIVYTGGFTVRNVSEQMDYTNYTRTGAGTYYTCSGSGTPVANVGPSTCYSPVTYWNDKIRSTHLSNEFRVSSPDDWRLRFIAGAYEEQFYIRDDMNFDYKTIPSCSPNNLNQALTGGLPCLANLVPLASTRPNDPTVRSDPTAFGEDTRRGYDQWAGFVSFDYDILPELTVTAGSRWYQYNEFETGTQYGTDTSCLNVPNGQCGGDTVNIGGGKDYKTYAGIKSRINLSWHITPDVMAYGTWSQGFRPGGFNRSGGNVAPGPGGTAQFSKPLSYAPDSLTNNEIGMKGTFLDNKLLLNLSAYYMIWDNVQFLFFNPTYFGNTTFGLNGPNFDDEGVEFQFTAKPFDGLTLSGSGDYDENTVNSSRCLVNNISGSAGFGQCITQIIPKGSTAVVPLANPFGTPGGIAAFSPKYQANFRARYDWLDGRFAYFVSGGVSIMGSMYNQPSTYADGNLAGPIPTTTFLRYKQPSYETFDAQFGVAMDKWNAEIYGENLGDSDASTFTSSAQFIKSEVPLHPRVIGLKIGYTY